MRLATAAVVALVAVTATAEGASLKKLDQRERRQQASLLRYHGTLMFFRHHPLLARTETGRKVRRTARIWTRVTLRELADTRRERREHLAAARAARTRAVPVAGVDYWAGRQMWAAGVIAAESAGDPWPNCADPWDGGSFGSLVQCENSGNWYDSPGFFRCGLQFDPAWEQRFGRLCP